MWALWLFKKFPILWIIVGILVGANSYFKFNPGTAMSGPQAIIIPVLFFAIGIGLMIYNTMSKK